MAGNITLKRDATSTITTTNLVSASAASQTLVGGWTSTGVTSATSNAVDFEISGVIRVAAANNQAGTIAIYVIPALNDTPTWPTAVSSGTFGTESATPVVFADTNHRDSIAVLLKAISCTATASASYEFSGASIAAAFGGTPPSNWCLWITNNATTTTTTGFQATCALYYQAVYAQYT